MQNYLRFRHTKTRIILLFCVISLIASGCAPSDEKDDSSTPRYDEYSTYAFFGVDSRADGEEWKTDDSTGTQGAPSSDVILILSINEDTKNAKILSVYRDTMLDVAGDGSDLETCNTAFRNGGAYGAIDMLEKNLDLHIDGYVTANFMVVANAIDLIGGVTVDVEDEKTYKEVSEGLHLDTVVDTANTYIDEMNIIYDKDTPYIEKPGKQKLTGLQAVAYSRVRYTEGSDRKRTERQRNVVLLMAQELRNSDAETQHSVLKEMYREVDTDLAENELMELFNLIIGYDIDNMGGFPFYMTSIIDNDKGTLLVPCDLESNVSELHKYLYNSDTYVPSEVVTDYSKLITDETGMTKEDAKEGLTKF